MPRGFLRRLPPGSPAVRHARPCKGRPAYGRILKSLAKTDLLILDDWEPEKLNDDQRRDLLEIIERYERRSTIVTSQVPWIAGTKLLQTQRLPMPSWIASFTTPIASISPVKACEKSVRQ
jgi:hypothetical protein